MVRHGHFENAESCLNMPALKKHVWSHPLSCIFMVHIGSWALAQIVANLLLLYTHTFI